MLANGQSDIPNADTKTEQAPTPKYTQQEFDGFWQLLKTNDPDIFSKFPNYKNFINEPQKDAASPAAGKTPLFYALSRNYQKSYNQIIKQLLADGADPNLVDPTNKIGALEYAAIDADAEVLTLLLNTSSPSLLKSIDALAKALNNAIERTNATAVGILLREAMTAGYLQKVMVKVFELSNCTLNQGLTALHQVCEIANDLVKQVLPYDEFQNKIFNLTIIAQLLIDINEDLAAKDKKGKTPLAIVEIKEDTAPPIQQFVAEITAYHLRRAITFEPKEAPGFLRMPTLYFIGSPLQELFAILENFNSKVGKEPEPAKVTTALKKLKALENPHQQTEEDKNDDQDKPLQLKSINQKNRSGDTVLHVAANIFVTFDYHYEKNPKDHQLTIVTTLIAAGADANAKDKLGRTVAMRAIPSGNVELVTSLFNQTTNKQERARIFIHALMNETYQNMFDEYVTGYKKAIFAIFVNRDVDVLVTPCVPFSKSSIECDKTTPFEKVMELYRLSTSYHVLASFAPDNYKTRTYKELCLYIVTLVLDNITRVVDRQSLAAFAKTAKETLEPQNGDGQMFALLNKIAAQIEPVVAPSQPAPTTNDKKRCVIS